MGITVVVIITTGTTAVAIIDVHVAIRS